MGIDASISFPPNVQVNDVAAVAARLLGCEAARKTLDEESGSTYAAVTGIEVQSIKDLPECVRILIREFDAEGNKIRSLAGLLYHFEWSGGRRGIFRSPTPRNIALLRGLADFFGGKVDYNDCDSTKCDYEVPDKSNTMNCPEDGKPWQDLQDRILAVKPISKETLDECKKYTPGKDWHDVDWVE
jgi:hypothetical protein